jgi:DNA polymerase
MRLKYPKLRKDEDGNWVYSRKGNVIKLYGGILCENIVQALARILVAAEQLLAIAAVYPVVMTTHDEVVACVPKTQAKKCEVFMQACLRQAPDWAPDLPVTCETGYAENYSK